MEDSSVNTIMLEFNSPGGQVRGLPELADKIYAARGRKHVVAFVDALAASAAFWLATQADEVVITPSGSVGSVGVYMMHINQQKRMEASGIEITYISAGEYKVEGNPLEPLSEEARKYLQGRVNENYDQFLSAVARGRSTTPEDARENYGRGRIMTAREAVEVGAADSIETYDHVLERLQRMGNRAAAPTSNGFVANGQSVMTGTDGQLYYNANMQALTPDWQPIPNNGFNLSIDDTYEWVATTTDSTNPIDIRPSVGGNHHGGDDMAETHQDNAADAGVQPSVEELQAALAEAEQRAEIAETAQAAMGDRITALEDARKRKEYTEVALGQGGAADGSAPWHGDIEAHVDLLMSFGDDTDRVEKYVALQNQTAAALREAGLFSERGSDQERSVANSAREEFTNAISAEMAANSELSFDDAAAKVARENHGLYQRYNAEIRVK